MAAAARTWQVGGVLLDGPPAQVGLASHAALPWVDVAAPDGPRLYWTSRDERGRSHVCAASLEVDAGGELSDAALHLAVAGDAQVVLAPGELGAFDDAGCTMSCAVTRPDGATDLWYSGWTLGVSVPFRFFGGLATSRDGGRTFTRASRGPLLGPDDVDPFLSGSPTVLHGPEGWRLWYISATGWTPGDPPTHHYHLRTAGPSADGRAFERAGEVALPFEGDEYAIARASVRHLLDGTHELWACARGGDRSYELVRATSPDGRDWTRDHAAVVPPRTRGFDDEMQCYPHVVTLAGHDVLFWNGNGYGRSGIAWAVAEH
jgi:hypothetical protein